MRRRWEVVRCWAGQTSTLVPEPTGWRFWTRWGAARLARKASAYMSNVYYEVRRHG